MAKKKTQPVKQVKRAAIYCRVSTFDQNRGDYSSLEDQEQRLRRAVEDDGGEVFQSSKKLPVRQISIAINSRRCSASLLIMTSST